MACVVETRPPSFTCRLLLHRYCEKLEQCDQLDRPAQRYRAALSNAEAKQRWISARLGLEASSGCSLEPLDPELSSKWPVPSSSKHHPSRPISISSTSTNTEVRPADAMASSTDQFTENVTLNTSSVPALIQGHFQPSSPPIDTPTGLAESLKSSPKGSESGSDGWTVSDTSEDLDALSIGLLEHVPRPPPVEVPHDRAELADLNKLFAATVVR